MINLTASGIERCSRIIYFPSILWKASSVRLSRVLKNAAWLFPSVDFVLEEQGYRFKFFGISAKTINAPSWKIILVKHQEVPKVSDWLSKNLIALLPCILIGGIISCTLIFVATVKHPSLSHGQKIWLLVKAKGKITHTVNSNYSPIK